MGEETRTRFTWTWAGLLAGVVLVGASYGSRAQPTQGEPPARLAQLDPSLPGTPPTTPGLTPPPATTPSFGAEDAGVGGSGFVLPPPTLTGPDAGYGTSMPDTGMGGSGLPPPGAFDGGRGF